MLVNRNDLPLFFSDINCQMYAPYLWMINAMESLRGWLDQSRLTLNVSNGDTVL